MVTYYTTNIIQWVDKQIKIQSYLGNNKSLWSKQNYLTTKPI